MGEETKAQEAPPARAAEFGKRRECGDDHALAVWFTPDAVREHDETLPEYVTDEDLASSAIAALIDNELLWRVFDQTVQEIAQTATTAAARRETRPPREIARDARSEFEMLMAEEDATPGFESRERRVRALLAVLCDRLSPEDRGATSVKGETVPGGAATSVRRVWVFTGVRSGVEEVTRAFAREEDADRAYAEWCLQEGVPFDETEGAFDFTDSEYGAYTSEVPVQEGRDPGTDTTTGADRAEVERILERWRADGTTRTGAAP